MSYSAQVGGIDEWEELVNELQYQVGRIDEWEELDNELQCPGRWN